eukprot:TRINITY_DN2061_c0_g1_i1.p1 TRINITY_DN2061_c0_g1~~TRINITY_DN2061_c0_g1_i1.p1  ORF type:complete len:311 (+),score=78.69 TRINITY_DN2061_c0_g1_i1:85-1017(+)
MTRLELTDTYRREKLGKELRGLMENCKSEDVEKVQASFIEEMKKSFTGCESVTVDDILSWYSEEMFKQRKKASGERENIMIAKHVELSKKVERQGMKALHLSRGVLNTMFVSDNEPRNWAGKTWYSLVTNEGHCYFLGTDLETNTEWFFPAMCRGIMFEVEQQTKKDDNLAHVKHLEERPCVFYGVDPDTEKYELKTSMKNTVAEIQKYKKDMFQIESWLGGMKGVRVRTANGNTTELPTRPPTKAQWANFDKSLNAIQSVFAKAASKNTIQKFDIKKGKVTAETVTAIEVLPEFAIERMNKIINYHKTL